jgi:hypothetical protein
LGIIPNDVGLKELRARCEIGKRARACPEGAEFSAWIRGRSRPKSPERELGGAAWGAEGMWMRAGVDAGAWGLRP